MLNIDLLQQKISNDDYRRLISMKSIELNVLELTLLNQILEHFEFNTVQAQALTQAVIHQLRFDPNAFHIDNDDEDTSSICPHCIHPPMPPLRDYLLWREKQN